MTGLTRRGALTLGGAAAATVALKPWAWAEGRSGLHGLSIFGDLKYAPDFTHFDYVNPDAPKGGRMNFGVPNWILNQNPQTFNTLNAFVLKGDSPPRMGMIFDSLMTRAFDEPDAVYGLVARSVDVSDDGNVFTFHLRPEARFHDGTPLTAEDVAYSLNLIMSPSDDSPAGDPENALTKGHPVLTEPLKPMASAVAADAGTLVITLDGTQNRDTILSIVAVPIFSKAYYETRDFEAATLEPPMGSGAYKVGRLGAGRYIEYERVDDYWAKDLPVNAGHNNFGIIRIDFFAERQAAFEAFKKGEITFREEFTSITWAQDYNFPAVTEGKVVKSTDFASERRPAYQAFHFNTRRGRFRDPRTRQALALAFDFEWSNQNLFFGSYVRQHSMFGASDYGASAPPNAAELAILEPFRDSLPADAFGPPSVPPETDGSGRDRTILRQASDLLAAAGWQQMSGVVVDEEGAPLEVELLIDAEVFERILTPYVANLKSLGVEATIRQIDPTQYSARLTEFDFDIILAAYSFAATPVDGLQQFFSSNAAASSGSYNYSGAKEPAIDAAIAKLPAVASRDDLMAITRVIDRVYRAGQYVVPGWRLANHRLVFWDIFGHPDVKADYYFSPEAWWWFDKDRAEAIGYTG